MKKMKQIMKRSIMLILFMLLSVTSVFVVEASAATTTKRYNKITGVNTYYSKNMNSSDFKLSVKAKGIIRYKSSNTKVVKVSSTGVVSIKGVGSAYVTITAGNNIYKNVSKKVQIKVVPARVKITSIASNRKKSLSIKWEKMTGISGYKLQYATDKSFSDAKTSFIGGTRHSKTRADLTAGKKYYVRICAYRKINKNTYYGAWSQVKACNVRNLTIKLNKSTAVIYTTGKNSIQLKATVTDSNSKVKWTTSDKSIATVSSNGTVTAKNEGVVTITAKINSVSATCKVWVNSYESIWNDFLNNREYYWDVCTEENYVSEFEYVITDLNADGIPELLIQGREDSGPFYYTWTYALKNEEVILVDKTYGYGSFRYNERLNLVLCSPEFASFLGTDSSPFYSLKGTGYNYEFSIIQDCGEFYYRDENGRTSISEEERATYFSGITDFKWSAL